MAMMKVFPIFMSAWQNALSRPSVIITGSDRQNYFCEKVQSKRKFSQTRHRAFQASKVGLDGFFKERFKQSAISTVKGHHWIGPENLILRKGLSRMHVFAYQIPIISGVQRRTGWFFVEMFRQDAIFQTSRVITGSDRKIVFA